MVNLFCTYFDTSLPFRSQRSGFKAFIISSRSIITFGQRSIVLAIKNALSLSQLA